jgi:mannose-6-phosphate isomerase
MRALARFNDRFGLHPDTGALMDVLWSDGTVSSAGQRLWPQTERLKAEMLRRDPDDNRILAAYAVLQAHIAPAPAGLWMEQRLEDGGFARMAAPASSLYHLTSAYVTAARILRSRLI